MWNLFSLFSDTAVGINTDSETIATGHLCVISRYQNCENEGMRHQVITHAWLFMGFFSSFFGGGEDFLGGFPHLFEHIILVIVS